MADEVLDNANDALEQVEPSGEVTTSVSGAGTTPTVTIVSQPPYTAHPTMTDMAHMPVMNPAGPVQPVPYQQVDLGHYIDQQVQAKMLAYGNMAAFMQMPQTRPQFPAYYPSGPMAMMGGMPGSSTYPQGGMMPSNTVAPQPGGLKPPTRKRPRRSKGRSEDPSGNRSGKEKATAASLFTAVKAGPAPRATEDDDAISIYASGDNFSQADESDESDESDTQTAHSQESDVSSEDDTPPEKGKDAPPVKGKGSAPDPSTASSPGMKPELQAALSAAIPVFQTSDAILPDLAETIKSTWQKPLDQAKVESILGKIHPPDNAVFLRVQRTNERVYKMLKKPAIAQDASIQKTQQLTTSAAAQTAQLLHKLNVLPVGTKVDDALLKELMIPLAETFTLLSHATAKLNLSRKNKISRAVPKQYASIRSCAFPASEFLFGDDIDSVLATARKQSFDQKPASKPSKFNNKGSRSRKTSKPKNGKGKWSGQKKKDGQKKKEDKDQDSN